MSLKLSRSRKSSATPLPALPHLCLALPNAMIQEGVRAYHHGWYHDVVTTLPHVDYGAVAAPSGPGLGTRLVEGFAEREDGVVRASA